MLDAADLEQVLSWKERQLGDQASASSVMPLEGDWPNGWVERSGTGIRTGQFGNCEPLLSLMADSVQRVVGVNHDSVHPADWCRMAELRNRDGTLH